MERPERGWLRKQPSREGVLKQEAYWETNRNPLPSGRGGRQCCVNQGLSATPLFFVSKLEEEKIFNSISTKKILNFEENFSISSDSQVVILHWKGDKQSLVMCGDDENHFSVWELSEPTKEKLSVEQMQYCFKITPLEVEGQAKLYVLNISPQIIRNSYFNIKNCAFPFWIIQPDYLLDTKRNEEKESFFRLILHSDWVIPPETHAVDGVLAVLDSRSITSLKFVFQCPLWRCCWKPKISSAQLEAEGQSVDNQVNCSDNGGGAGAGGDGRKPYRSSDFEDFYTEGLYSDGLIDKLRKIIGNKKLFSLLLHLELESIIYGEDVDLIFSLYKIVNGDWRALFINFKEKPYYLKYFISKLSRSNRSNLDWILGDLINSRRNPRDTLPPLPH